LVIGQVQSLYSSLADPAGEFVIAQVQLLQHWHAIAQIRWEYMARKLVIVSNEIFKPKALFSSQKILQNLSHSSSHRIFRRMHEVLNIDKNKN
jgi:hypothetical protein